MSFGFTEMLVLLAIILALSGAGKLPTVMGDLAKGVRNFKAGLKDDPETAPERHIAQAAGEARPLQEPTKPGTPAA
jgi:sec-independent protein translocase protein TatA